MLPDLSTFLARSAVLHNHLCPRQVLGVRMGLYAALLLDVENRWLQLPQTDKRLYGIVETDGCFADGVMVATGCSLGHRTLRLIDYGKIAATFIDTQTERAIRVTPEASARTRAAQYAPHVEKHWQAQLEAYQIMPYAELFAVQEVRLNFSLKSLISQPGIRTVCSICGEEIINQREIAQGGDVVCKSCAGESYWLAGCEHSLAATLDGSTVKSI